jgi:hypothetical protein
MFDAALDDFINPKFVFFDPAPTAATDTKQIAQHIDRAIIALDSRAPIGGDCCIEQLAPVPQGSTVRIDLWVKDLDDYTCTYSFLVSSESGSTLYARGERMVVSVNPHSHRREKWSSDFRHTHEELLKDLPAYA